MTIAIVVCEGCKTFCLTVKYGVVNDVRAFWNERRLSLVKQQQRRVLLPRDERGEKGTDEDMNGFVI